MTTLQENVPKFCSFVLRLRRVFDANPVELVAADSHFIAHHLPGQGMEACRGKHCLSFLPDRHIRKRLFLNFSEQICLSPLMDELP